MGSRFTVALAITALGAASLPAQTGTSARAAGLLPAVDSSLFAGLHFRMVGPPRGGRVTTVTGVPSQPRTFYMGVASGGVFKTTDGGDSWHPVTDGQVPLGSTGSIAVAESDPNVVYLGTGSDDIRSNVSTGRGVYKSTDAGATWHFAGLRDVGQIGAVRIDPRDPNVVYVAAIGDAFKPSPERGVYKSTDGGQTWRKLLFISDSTGAADLEIQPGNPDVIYASMWRGQRKPWTIISGAMEGGLYKSTDAGEHWTKLAGGLPTGLFGKSNIAVTAADPQRVYALIEAKPGGGLYRSNDAGATWKLMSTNPQLITRPFYYTTLGADPTNADVLYGGAENFYKSTDGGATWRIMRTPHGDNHDIWINPHDGNTMIQANDGGANVSYDGGRTWSTQMNQPTAEIYGVWLDDQFPYRLYGAQQDASTVIVPSRPIPGDNDPFKDGPGCETGPIMPHPGNPNVVYGACKGQFGREFMNVGQEQAYWVGAQSLYGNDAKDLIYRFQRVSPMETSPFDTSIVYYGSQYLHRSRDGGVHWETISPDLTAHPACCQGASGEPITRDVTGEEFYSTLYAIASSKLQPGVIWTGSNDGPFYVTRDNGKTWTNVTPRDLPPGGRVQYIETSPSRKGAAYYAVYRYLLGDYHPYIYATTDYGKTWKLLTDGHNGIPADEPTRVVREDPVRAGLLYAGTEFGLYISFDNGSHWQPFQLNLPNVPVTDIKIHDNDLVLATQGRSFWILDDITPLRQITARTATTPAVLFAPRTTPRTRPERGGARGPGQAEFPPNGVALSYALASAASSPVTLEIRDSSGALVRRLTSAASAAAARGRGGAADENADDEAPRFRRGGAPVRLTANAGMNRVTWDFNDENGEIVPPGKYQVRLTAGSATASQPLVLTMDPREAADGLTAADLRAQYRHNLKMRAFAAEAQRLAARVRQARSAQQRGTPGNVEPHLAALATTLFGAGEGVRYGAPGLLTQITYLASMTERADQRVGNDALVRYAELRKQLDAAEAAAAKVLPADR
jgi:photosystem II stability/assembly factor-like uncharacterized protein